MIENNKILKLFKNKCLNLLLWVTSSDSILQINPGSTKNDNRLLIAFQIVTFVDRFYILFLYNIYLRS